MSAVAIVPTEATGARICSLNTARIFYQCAPNQAFGNHFARQHYSASSTAAADSPLSDPLALRESFAQRACRLPSHLLQRPASCPPSVDSCPAFCDPVCTPHPHSRPIRKARITAASPSQRTLPLQRLVDRDGQSKPALAIIIEEALAAGIEEIAE